ncbi:MAG: PKD domain-containing protein [Methanocalculus sp. MSAO_Arc1]|uniref:PKD domain-containing protein n=1 Tax=Methanocalculus TaxID=71151 RepID=UPI000FF202CE|nr:MULTISPECIES: PKD domain-containing protein [unclassified Methanocalculus]MCP1662933.1 PKD repeat protein [Methanocalculus sp. AMF5]RQD79450.1 MAG: PKD domain-containing protein [Methanocalculus sp. MSAO_Arc1]
MRSLLLVFLALLLLCGIASAVNVMVESDTKSGVIPAQITFTGSVSGNETGVTEWSWQFRRVGDPITATPIVASGRTVTPTFNRPGTWRGVLHVVTDGENFQSRPYEVVIYEGDYVPIPGFTASATSGTAPLTVTFTDDSTHKPTSWHWNFGDGASGTGPRVTHTYTEPGTYSITLRIENPAGSFSQTWRDKITVYQRPVAAFSVDETSGEPPFTVSFTDESRGGITTWEWDFGDGEQSSEQNPVHTYERPGVYPVRLKVHNPYDSDTLVRDNLVIVATRPVVDFTADVVRGSPPLTVQFTDISGGNPNQWRWDFGDGKTARTRNPEHTYQYPGTFKVTLTASGGQVSGSLSRSGYITVIALPEADFSVDRTIGSAPLKVRFSDKSSGGAEAWRWDFGDGKISRDRHPEHIYTEPGTYTVTQTVRNEFGFDVVQKTDLITVMQPTVTPVPEPEDPETMTVTANDSSVTNRSPAFDLSLDIPFINPKDLFSEYIRLIREIMDAQRL